jgi:hypothetical protein
MTENKFQTEWIVAHLLFPNSAQAREIYLYIVSQVISQNQLTASYDQSKLIFKVAMEIFRKTHVIQSGQSFIEFNQTQFKLWPKFYKTLSKDEVLLVVAIVFLELKLSDIAILFKVSTKQLESKFTQILNKLIAKPQSIQSKQYEFKFRSVNTLEKSDFIFYDDIIKGVFSLGSISAIDLKNDLFVDSRLHLRKYYDSVLAFKEEVSGLKKQSYQTLEPQIQVVAESKSKFLNLKKLTVFLPTSFVTISILILLFLRPQFIHEAFSTGKNETIEIQQIKIDRHIENKDLQNSEPEQASVTPETQPTQPQVPLDVKAKNNDTKPASDTATKVASVTKPDSKPNLISELPQEKTKPATASSAGGLYRGKLVVTDVQQVIGVVREKIINSGGKKAGEVELGWMKNETTSYFHFSFPEENKADLENYLKQFGKVQLVYEPHPRLMPKGIKRYIIEIQQNE